MASVILCVKMAARLTAEFLKDWKKEVNPDLQKERDTCTFNIQELTFMLDGGPEKTKRRKELENIFFTRYADLFSFKKRSSQSKSEMYESSVAKSVKVFQMKREQNWSEEDFEMTARILNYDFALSLHHTMFIPAIERLATDEQKAQWLPLAQSYQIIGTYAQTELGHGTNLLGLETTATFDRATDEFVLNTPRLSSMKWWPGGLAKSSTHAIVLSQLLIDGNNHGMHPFMVQLRSLDDHMPMPGIKVGDIGKKIGANMVDNGYLILDKVRIPRQNMFMRNATVTKDGKFTQLSNNKANYATMVLVRVNIISWTRDMMRHAACVSVRYSAVRRQTTLKPGTPEQQVLDFQTQQLKTFPALAAAYACHLIAEDMLASYHAAYTEIMSGNNRKLAELHAQSSGLKAFLTDMSTAMVETCRRSCGGHGYLMSSGVAQNMVSTLALVTIEGENTVLYLQTARYLMKQMANAVSGTKTDGPTAYMNRDFTSYVCPIEVKQDCRNLNKLREVYTQRAHRVVMSVAQKLQLDMESSLPQEIVFNKNMVELVRAAKAHLHLTVIDIYITKVDNLRATCSTELYKVMTELCNFFVVHGMVQESGDFLEMETLGLSQMEWLRQEEMELLEVLRPNAVGLVDAFDMHDETVASTLGQYDGNAYQHLFESTQNEPMNQTEVHPAYYKHLRGLLKGTNQSKL
ncbi:peroxisomal acyl-coenzyme A oxidase 1-like [Mercenaria mercenaria]|uniref:peroxisomal acyl-coenzyme A oxidase 1-like n=1 Tax=Mercenaria mercenaria TaxID=6596 RepID=UPI00234E977B|nr:peroxisomal acyl-coenzyme A oxidase 1-like [Mercenaria mercenaria]